MPAVLAISRHFTVSDAMKLAKSCGEPGAVWLPMAASLSWISWERSPLSIAAFSLLTISRRRAGGRDNARPESDGEFGKSVLRQRRHVGQLRMTSRAGDCERLDPVLADQRGEDRDVGEGGLDLLAQHRRHQLCAALVGDVGRLA